MTALVRDAERAKAIADRHPQVTLVEGDLDSYQLIEDQVSQADIVISCNILHCQSFLLTLLPKMPPITNMSLRSTASDKVSSKPIDSRQVS